MSDEVMQDLLCRTEALERALRRWRLAASTCLLGFAACAATLGARVAASDVLHVRGLVVEDDAGRPRLVLGAPVSRLEGRKRTDGTVALLVLDEDGDERVALGYQPDPMIGGQIVPRKSPSVGLNVFDGGGNERGGLGLLESGSVVLGLDTDNGREGVSLFVDDTAGHSGIMLGSRQGGHERLGLYVDDERALLKVSDTRGAERLLLMATDTSDAQLLVLDADHEHPRDLLVAEIGGR